MKKIILLPLLLVIMTGPVAAQMILQINNCCFEGPHGGAVVYQLTTLDLIEIGDSTVSHSEFTVKFPYWTKLDSAYIIDPDFSGGTLTYNADSLRFNWDTPDSFNLVIGTLPLLQLRIKMDSAIFDSTVIDYTNFINYVAQPVPIYNSDGHFSPTPKILRQPADTTVCDGHSASFAILAEGYGMWLNYGWSLSDNSPFVWQNINDPGMFTGYYGDSLGIYEADSNLHQHWFRCRVSNYYCPDQFSDSAQLQVILNVITQPLDQSVHLNDTAVFLVASASPSAQYLWESSIDGGVSWSSTQLFPQVTTPMLTLIHPPISWNGYRFRCIVTNECLPPEITRAALLTVTDGSGISSITLAAGSCFPNPMTTGTTFTPAFSGQYELRLFDLMGREVQHLAACSGISSIQRGSLPSGTYLLVVRSADGRGMKIPLILE